MTINPSLSNKPLQSFVIVNPLLLNLIFTSEYLMPTIAYTQDKVRCFWPWPKETLSVPNCNGIPLLLCGFAQKEILRPINIFAWNVNWVRDPIDKEKRKCFWNNEGWRWWWRWQQRKGMRWWRGSSKVGQWGNGGNGGSPCQFSTTLVLLVVA